MMAKFPSNSSHRQDYASFLRRDKYSIDEGTMGSFDVGTFDSIGGGTVTR